MRTKILIYVSDVDTSKYKMAQRNTVMVLGSKVINESDKMTKVMNLTIRKCTRKKV